MANKGLNLQLGLLYYNQRKNRCTFEDWKPAELGKVGFWYGYQTNEKGVSVVVSLNTGKERKIRLNYCTLPDDFYAEIEDAEDANLRWIDQCTLDRYETWHKGQTTRWHGTDSHLRVYDKHGNLIAKCPQENPHLAFSRQFVFMREGTYKRWKASNGDRLIRGRRQ